MLASHRLMMIMTALVTALPVVLPGAARAQVPTTVTWRIETRATVETVDHARRELLLRDATGELTTLEVGQEVRNLPQVRAGDRVAVRYQLSIAAEMAQPGSAAPRDEASRTDNAPSGARPGQRVTDRARFRVRVEAVDIPTRTVSLIGPRRIPRRFTLETPEMLDFARGLNPGDEVDVTYSEMLEVKIEAP